ncbi:hypothetical protein D3C72_2192140 [compost metagenome]
MLLPLYVHVEFDDVGIDRRADVHAVGRAEDAAADHERNRSAVPVRQLYREPFLPCFAARRQRAFDGG